MEVVILRHGKVNYPPVKILSAREFVIWVESYNTNQLDRSIKPNEGAIRIARSAGAVVCSDLPRSVESAEYLGVDKPTIIDPVFQEAGLPIGSWKFLRFSVRLWAIIFRILWFFGYSHGSESVKDAKFRAKQSAQKLIQLAQDHNLVLFVGHGIMNRLIAKELRKSGWEGPKVPSRKYWEYAVYKVKHNNGPRGMLSSAP